MGALAGGLTGSARRYLVTIIAISLAFGLLALVLPHPYPTFDESKYLAIGTNVLAGRGPLTAFGAPFMVHAPLWPMIFAAPDAAFGLDPWSWGHLLNAVAGVAVLLLAARLAWRFGPPAALLTTAVLAGWVGLFGLTRTARLDVPEAALTLAYLAMAMSAVDTGKLRHGLLAGGILGIAFLTKEAVVPVAIAPFVAGLALRRPIGHLLRAAGAGLLVSVPLVAWWFAWYAGATHRIFLLGLGEDLLLPLGVGLLVAAVAILAVGTAGGRSERLRLAIDARMARRRFAIVVAGVVAAVWLVAVLLGFSHSNMLLGRAALDVGQMLRWARSWATDIAGVTLVGFGAIAAAVAVVRGDDRPIEALAALVASVPWVVAVTVLAEPPRNLIAELAILAAVGSGGWLLVAEAVRERPVARAMAGAAIGAGLGVAALALASRAGVLPGFARRTVTIVAGVGVLAVAGAALATRGWRERASSALRRRGARAALPDGAQLAVVIVTACSLFMLGAVGVRAVIVGQATSRSALAADIAGWLDANVPHGSTVMFGSLQANETALILGGHYNLRSLKATMGVEDPGAPLGIDVAGRAAPDLVVVDPHPRQRGYLVLTASNITKALAARPAAIVYVTGIPTAAPSMVDWLSNAPGIRLAATFRSSLQSPELVARVYRVDPATLQVRHDRIYASAAAVDLLAHEVAGFPSARSVASALAERLVVTDPGPAADAAVARLRALAGR